MCCFFLWNNSTSGGSLWWPFFHGQVQAEANATYNATAYAEATYTAWCSVASAVHRCLNFPLVG